MRRWRKKKENRKHLEFEAIKNEAGDNSFVMIPKRWNLNREIAKLNYRIHTDAIKDNLIPPELTPEQISYKYANEADLLNVALFGRTAKQWRDGNPGKKGKWNDGFAPYGYKLENGNQLCNAGKDQVSM